MQEGGSYARVTRLSNHELLVAYSRGAALRVRCSTDEGTTWQPEVTVASIDGCLCANAELLVLPDGEVLAFFNERPLAA